MKCKKSIKPDAQRASEKLSIDWVFPAREVLRERKTAMSVVKERAVPRERGKHRKGHR